MSPSYVIEQIGPNTIDRAYPLARIMTAALQPDDWRQFCHSFASWNAKRELAGEREEIVVARNAEGYVKGLCIYAIREHATYGRLVDVPFFVVASAADGEGVASAFLDFLLAKCDKSVSSGIRIWSMTPETWSLRLRPEQIARSDHGLFMPALASPGEIGGALCAHCIGNVEAIGRFSR